MNDKKNLDRLFQEKFKDFEVEPNEQVWENIEAALRKKKKRRAVPIWYRLSGVAAALIIGALLFNSITDSGINTPENKVVIEENGTKDIKKTEGVALETNSGNATDTERSSEKSLAKPDNLSNPENKVANSGAAKDPLQKKPADASNSGLGKNDATQNAVAAQSDKKQKKNSLKNPGIAIDYNNAVTAKAKKPAKKDHSRNFSDSQSVNESDTGIAASDKKKQSSPDKIISVENSAKNQENPIADTQGAPKNTIQKATNANPSKTGTEAIAAVEIKKLDSTAIATVEPNALEELLKENEKEKNVIAETKLNRWQIKPQIAPIYFGSTSEGSPIDQQFSDNDKSFDKNLSYGVAVNYSISKKLNVRTGINKLTLGYNTNGVSFAAGLAGRSIESIGTAENLAGIQIISADMSSSLLPFETSIQSIKTGSISQTMGYVEVPMELSYKLLDRKFGINLIGGISTLFLDENTVSISSSDVSASLGKATNLNDVHFSSNFGVGFKYSFLKSFEFNFEPTLKYQINTFSKNAGDFKPYFLGLYSGVSFRF